MWLVLINYLDFYILNREKIDKFFYIIRYFRLVIWGYDDDKLNLFNTLRLKCLNMY
jgi:hypothetical protein